MAGLVGATRSILVADAPLAAVVAERIYAFRRQQGEALPAVVIKLDEPTEPVNDLDGHGGLTRVVVTVSSVATTLLGAEALAALVLAALNEYKGTSEDVIISSCVHDNDIVNDEDSEVSNDQGDWIIASEYVIWYKS